MRYGSLYSGIGGIDLAVEHALGATCAWQCEQDPFRRAVLEQHWPGVPRFVEAQAAASTATAIDLVCGGFVCKDISTAGKGRGIEGARSGGTWRCFERTLERLRPSFAFIENVAALRSRGGAAVLGELAALGYDARWTTLRASDVGAPHHRDRIWILAYADSERLRQLAERVERIAAVRGNAEHLDDRARRDVADPGLSGHASETERRIRRAPEPEPEPADGREDLRADWPPGRRDDDDTRRRWGKWLARNPGCEPGLCGAPHGLPGWMVARWRVECLRRLAALGDAAVPQQAAAALVDLICGSGWTLPTTLKEASP